jgi:orotate phosphoribosyltransferase
MSDTDVRSLKYGFEGYETLLKLLCEHCYEEGDFTLSSGQKSDYYVNVKTLAYSPHLHLIISGFSYFLQQLEVFSVAGMELGAISLISGVTQVHRFYILAIRKEPKGYGALTQVEGMLPKDKTNEFVILEDVTTTGASSLRVVNVIRQLGYPVDTVITIVDREQGAVDLLGPEGVQLIPFYTITDLRRFVRSES